MRRRFLALLTLAAAMALLVPSSAGAQQTMEYDRWDDVKPMYFGDRSVGDGSGILTLKAPDRAHDAALVPIEVESKLAADDPRRIKAITLLVENNPIPLAGRFVFPGAPVRSLATRVRVESYSYIRAVAELSDGRLVKVDSFVKASGGCSAAAMKDPEEALAHVGEMQFRASGDPDAGKLVTAQLMVRHPNYNGMQFDQVSRTYIPAHYIEAIALDYAGEPLLAVQTDVSMSENPSVRMSFMASRPAAFTASVSDSKGGAFEESWQPFSGEGS